MAGVAGADHADHAFALDDLAILTSALDGRSDFHFRTPKCCIAFDSITKRPGVQAPVHFVTCAAVLWNAGQSPQFVPKHIRVNTIQPFHPFFKPRHSFFAFFLKNFD